jgi:hypothetical protein
MARMESGSQEDCCLSEDEAQQYGIGWDEVVPPESDSVEVPHNPLTDDGYAQLHVYMSFLIPFGHI